MRGETPGVERPSSIHQCPQPRLFPLQTQAGRALAAVSGTEPPAPAPRGHRRGPEFRSHRGSGLKSTAGIVRGNLTPGQGEVESAQRFQCQRLQQCRAAKAGAGIRKATQRGLGLQRCRSSREGFALGSWGSRQGIAAEVQPTCKLWKTCGKVE